MKKHPNRPAKHPRALQERDLQAIRGGDDASQNVMKKRHEIAMSMQIINNIK